MLQGEKELQKIAPTLSPYRDLEQSRKLLDIKGATGFLTGPSNWPGSMAVLPTAGQDPDTPAFKKVRSTREASVLAMQACVFEAEHQRTGTQPPADQLFYESYEPSDAKMPELSVLLDKPSAVMGEYVLASIVLAQCCKHIGSGLAQCWPSGTYDGRRVCRTARKLNVKHTTWMLMMFTAWLLSDSHGATLFDPAVLQDIQEGFESADHNAKMKVLKTGLVALAGATQVRDIATTCLLCVLQHTPLLKARCRL